MSKKITLLGSTGSIGTQSLDVIRAQGYVITVTSNPSEVSGETDVITASWITA